VNQGGLSFEQAPPLAVPLSFLLTAPLFAVAAGTLLLWFGADAFSSRWSFATLALVHLLTLGFIAGSMIGALTQILPVVAGSPLPRVVASSSIAYAGLVAGTTLLCVGLGLASPVLLRTALVLLSAGFLSFFVAAGYSAWCAPVRSPPVAAIRLALIALLIVVVAGSLLASELGGLLRLSSMGLTDAHAVWGMLGAVGLLIVGVGFEVVPMFQMTREYPAYAARWLPRALFGGLALWSIAIAIDGAYARWAAIPIAASLGGFALLTLRLQSKRRRPQADTLLWFWRVALASLLVVVCLWSLSPLLPTFAASNAYPLLLGTLLIGGFAYAAINGMMYKIVPFLLWFHMQSRRVGRQKIPNVKEILPERHMQRQFRVYVLAFALLLAATVEPELFARPAGLAFLVCSAWLWLNLLRAMTAWRRAL
jgi:hypothetical protein